MLNITSPPPSPPTPSRARTRTCSTHTQSHFLFVSHYPCKLNVVKYHIATPVGSTAAAVAAAPHPTPIMAEYTHSLAETLEESLSRVPPEFFAGSLPADGPHSKPVDLATALQAADRLARALSLAVPNGQLLRSKAAEGVILGTRVVASLTSWLERMPWDVLTVKTLSRPEISDVREHMTFQAVTILVQLGKGAKAAVADFNDCEFNIAAQYLQQVCTFRNECRRL